MDPSISLAELEVLVVDCQATGAAPAGHLLELGWARVGAGAVEARAELIALPAGVQVPRAVARITGIGDEMVAAGVEAGEAWRALAEEAAGLGLQPAPTVVHYAKFERPFLRALAGGTPPLDVVCTHEIACRLLPELPRRGLRALAGYFGRAVGELRRSADHVAATAFVWRELVQLLEDEGVTSWTALREWLDAPRVVVKQRRRVWPMAREVRLALPHAPGVYRFLRTTGDVLYVGKAISLHRRVNSYFRHQTGVPERTLEMLSQARDVSYEVTASALEAALLEADEIKRHRTPYNAALAIGERELWFASPDLCRREPRPSAECPVGPFMSAELLDQLAALAAGDHAVLAGGRWDGDSFAAGHERFRAAHPELVGDAGLCARGLLRVGARLWREGRRQRDVEDEDAVFRVPDWSPEAVQASLEWLALRGAHARRRAVWLTLLLESSVVWCEGGVALQPGGAAGEGLGGFAAKPGEQAGQPRLIVVADGEIVEAVAVGDGVEPPVPPGAARGLVERREGLTIERLDRVRVLSSELKRLVAGGAPVALRVGRGPALSGARLAGALWWV